MLLNWKDINISTYRISGTFVTDFYFLQVPLPLFLLKLVTFTCAYTILFFRNPSFNMHTVKDTVYIIVCDKKKIQNPLVAYVKLLQWKNFGQRKCIQYCICLRYMQFYDNYILTDFSHSLLKLERTIHTLVLNHCKTKFSKTMYILSI